MKYQLTPDNAPAPAVDGGDPALYAIQTNASGPEGSLPFDEDLLLHAPSGDIFGLSQNAGMGWNPRLLRRPVRVASSAVVAGPVTAR